MNLSFNKEQKFAPRDRTFSSVLKVKFLGNLIKNQHTFLQALPHPESSARESNKNTYEKYFLNRYRNLPNTTTTVKFGW